MNKRSKTRWTWCYWFALVCNILIWCLEVIVALEIKNLSTVLANKMLCCKNLGRIIIWLDLSCHFYGILIYWQHLIIQLSFSCSNLISHYHSAVLLRSIIIMIRQVLWLGFIFSPQNSLPVQQMCRQAPKWHPTGETKVCPHCGNTFNARGYGRHKQSCHSRQTESQEATAILLRSDSFGIWMWPGVEDQGSETHPADSYWLSFSHRYCQNEMSEVEVSQPAGVRNGLWWPFERHRDGGLRSKQRGQKEVM